MTKINNLKSRNSSEKRFRATGIFAIGLSLFFLLFLTYSIFSNGFSGFSQTQIRLKTTFTESDAKSGNFMKILRNSLDETFPGAASYAEKKALYGLVTMDGKFLLQDKFTANPELAGKTKNIWIPASEVVDIYYKQKFSDWENRVTKEQATYIDALKKKGLIKKAFNWDFFTKGDSQESEVAGIGGAIIGSLLVIVICIAIALPLGVLSAVYLEEFAPKNTFTDIIEININNLAAIPSIVYGLLGLSVYLNYMGMPRSAPIVGGLTLALMVIPIIIIATRAALKAVPPSIKQGAMALGASPLQVVLHHCVPLSLPGIMTGTILGVCRAIGETAPLLMIGMVAFIADVPKGFTDPASALPVQVFLWSKNNQPGFVEKTAAAIIVLLVILILMNIIAVWIRKKYDRRW
jgi:phosphate transport system permease protein